MPWEFPHVIHGRRHEYPHRTGGSCLTFTTTDSLLGGHTAISAIAAVFLFVPFARVVVRSIFPTTPAITVVAASVQRGTSLVVRVKARATHVMVAAGMSTPPPQGWFSLSSLPPTTFVLVPTLLPRPSPPFPLCALHTSSGASDLTNDGADGHSSSVDTWVKITGGDGEKEHHPCDGVAHECTPTGRVVLPFTLTMGDVRNCADTAIAAIAAVFRFLPSTCAMV